MLYKNTYRYTHVIVTYLWFLDFYVECLDYIYINAKDFVIRIVKKTIEK